MYDVGENQLSGRVDTVLVTVALGCDGIHTRVRRQISPCPGDSKIVWKEDEDYSSASEHSKVVPFETSPVCRPSLNHFMRCFDVPWLNDSGTA